MKHIFKAGISRSVLYFIVLTLMMSVSIMLFSFIIGDNSTFKLKAIIFLADAILIFAFYWLCSPRLRWLSLPVVWIISIFLFANALFFKYWGDMFPLSAIFDSSNYNSFIFNSIPALLSPASVALLIIPTLLTALYFIIKPYRSPSFTTKLKLIAVLVSVTYYIFAMFLSLNSVYNWNRANENPPYSYKEIFSRKFERYASHYYAWKDNGLLGYIAVLAANSNFNSGIRISDNERQEILRYIKENTISDSVGTSFAANKDKNLIFIIVESLNASVFNINPGNHKLAPVLSSLIKRDSVISSVNMLAQIADGGSSDGQLIYNTGLLPLLNGVAAQIFADNEYPSLVKALKPASSAEFIVEEAAVYNHRSTSKAFGYQHIHDRDSLLAAGIDPQITGYDDAIFDYAFNRIQSMPQPFVAEITTLSMHFPFDRIGFEPVAWIDSLNVDKYTKRYYQTVHYSDAAIGRFLSKIYQSPLAANSIVVIASDHDCNPANISDFDDPVVDFPIVFIALGTGHTLHQYKPMGQIDVFPTLLDIMGVSNDDYKWLGFGKSILSQGPGGAVSRLRRVAGNPEDKELERLNRAFTVSDSIIRSDFFRDTKL